MSTAAAPTTSSDGLLVFSNFYDTRLYRGRRRWPPIAITPEGGLRYADMVFDLARGRLIAVREDHTSDGEAVNTVVALDLAGTRTAARCSPPEPTSTANPRFSPDGKRAGLAAMESPEHAVGRLRAVGRPRSATGGR